MVKYQKNVIVILITILSFIQANAQRINNFQRAYGGDKDDLGCSAVVLPDHGYVIAGITRSYGNGNSDILLVRTDSLGKTIWSKTFGGNGNEGIPYYLWNAGVDVILSPDSNIMVCTSTQSYGAGGSDVYLFKINLNGNVLWSKTYGGSGDDYGYAIINDPNGGYLISGQTFSYGAGSGDILVIKADSAGKISWAKAYGNSSNEEAGYQPSPTLDGNFLIPGYSYTSTTAYDQMFIKIDESGKLLLSKVYGTSSYDDGESITDVQDSSIFMSGFSYNFINGANTVATLSKFDKKGSLQWTYIYDENSHTAFAKMLYDKKNKYLNCDIIESDVDRIGLVRLDESGKVLAMKNYGPAVSSGYVASLGHSSVQLPSGGFIKIFSANVFGKKGWDFYFSKLDKNLSNPDSCNLSQVSLTPYDFTSYMHDNSYAFTTSNLSLTTGSGISSNTVNTNSGTSNDSLFCNPFVASFKGPDVCVNQIVQFNDLSYYNPVSWAWNFGDAGSSSNSSSSQNPSHTYSNPGTYIVKLTVTNGTQTDTVTKKITIHPLPVIAPWTTNISNYNTVTFIPQDTTIGKFQWYFGDPDSDSSPKKSPTFTYPAVKAKYIVKLIVTSQYGCIAKRTDSLSLKTSGIEPQPSTNISGLNIYPNPFKGITNISYKLITGSNVNISVFDLSGKKVAEMKNGFYNAGEYKDVFNASDYHCKDGIYILKLNVNGQDFAERIENLK